MLAPLTISYSDDVQGWTSFWSFIPDYMVYSSNSFYTFKNGNIYLHNSPSAQRTVYYPSTPYANAAFCSVRTVFNDSPLEVKLFKTVSLESTSAWTVSVFTDLISGNIDDSWFELKEGSYFAHIRRNPNPTGNSLTDFSQLDDQLSTRIIGIGNLLQSGPATFPYTDVLTINKFPQERLEIKDVSPPDQIYRYIGTTLTYIGDVGFVDNNTATGDPDIYLSYTDTLPLNGQELVAIKNSTAESYGARGYYMDITLTYDSSVPVELFEIGSTVFKSFM
jgi:hypothetical protein